MSFVGAHLVPSFNQGRNAEISSLLVHSISLVIYLLLPLKSIFYCDMGVQWSAGLPGSSSIGFVVHYYFEDSVFPIFVVWLFHFRLCRLFHANVYCTPHISFIFFFLSLLVCNYFVVFSLISISAILSSIFVCELTS